MNKKWNKCVAVLGDCVGHYLLTCPWSLPDVVQDLEPPVFVLQVDASCSVSCMWHMQLQPQGSAAESPQQAAVLSKHISKHQRLTQVQPLHRVRPVETMWLHCCPLFVPSLLLLWVSVPTITWAERHKVTLFSYHTWTGQLEINKHRTYFRPHYCWTWWDVQ